MRPATSFDPFSNLLVKDDKKKDENRPLEPGEFADLIGKLSTEKKAIIQVVIDLFRRLNSVISETRETVTEDRETARSRINQEVETTAKSILIALRRGEVDSKLVEKIKSRLYDALLLSEYYEQALDLYPVLKNEVGGRLNGIIALSQRLGILGIRGKMIEEYFSRTGNSRNGLLNILRNPSMITASPDKTLMGPLYHFGTTLPLFFLLSACSELNKGLCGNCDGTTEQRIRMILGHQLDGIPDKLLNRLCTFATTFG